MGMAEKIITKRTAYSIKKALKFQGFFIIWRALFG